jgi:hypothetical protein
MRFRRFGRSHHLVIEAAEDLARAAVLDEANWVATGAPLHTISCDETFLKLMDTDRNGRILCFEVTQAIEWLLRNLRDRSGVAARSTTLRLDAIDTDSGEGQRVRMSARKILDRLGLSDADEVTLDQVRQIKAKVESTPVSEAGVVLPEATVEAEIRQFLADVIATEGGAPHPGGSSGVAAEPLGKFLADAAAFLEWHDRGLIPPGADKTEIMPLGAATGEAYAALVAVRGKIDQYFAQCEALALDERFAQRMGWTDEELEGLDFDDPRVIENVLAKAPLAKGRPDRLLVFGDDVNPHYAQRLGRFRRQVVAAVLGEDAPTLSAGQWREMKAFFAAHQAWVEGKPGRQVEPLGVKKLRSYLDDKYAAAVRKLIAESTATAFVLDNIRLTEKLLLYQACLVDFANNFVSFPDLYAPDRRAMFEMGSLVMDGRRFNLAVRVENRADHAKIAATSNMCLLYVEVAPKGEGKCYEVAVPVTSGGKGNLCVGKHGVFLDRAGAECDAKVVSIIDNPISLSEALASPFKRLGRVLTGKIESLTADAEKKLDARAAQAFRQVGPAPGAAKPAAAPAARPSPGGMLMGLSVAGAAVGSALAYITKTLAETAPIAILIGVLAAVLVVLLPTSIVAFLKLRRRDLSAILEGSGWAVNARMRLTRRQSRFFTERPPYPRDARGVSRFPWGRCVAVAVVLAALSGAAYLARWYALRGRPAASQPALKAT